MTKAQKLNKVKALIKKWSKRLYIEDWDFTIKIQSEDDGPAASIKPDYIYKDATIWISPCAFKKPNNLDHIIKHELCHCLTEPLYRYCIDFLNSRFRASTDIEDQREILTEKIAKLL